MATDKFKSLKKKKKINIIESIGIVLAKNGLDGLSVVDISEEAEISRGTFYNYFDDKDDAVRAYLLYYIEKLAVLFEENYEENGNNYFLNMKGLYGYMVKVYNDERYKSVVQNAKYIFHVAKSGAIEEALGERAKQFEMFLYERIDKNKFDINTIDDMKILIQITGNILISTLVRLACGKEVSILEEQYNKKIDIIEKGFLR